MALPYAVSIDDQMLPDLTGSGKPLGERLLYLVVTVDK